MITKNRGDIIWSALIILVLAASLAAVVGLYVHERAKHVSNTSSVTNVSGESTQQYTWKLVTSWPKHFPGLGAAPENFAKLVEAMSGGRMKITVYGAGEIVPALGVFDAVSSGSVEMGHTAGYYYKGVIPSAAIFTAIPFGMNATELNAWIHYGGGLALWHDLYQPYNILPFAGGNTGMQMGGWFNKPINSVQDIRGLKMRIPGIAGEVFSGVGGSAVNIPGVEIYTSMQTGVIDATEWVGPYNDRSFGLHEVGEHYYYPGWHESSALLEFQVNLPAWKALPADLQAIIETAARAINQDMLDEYTARNAVSLEELKELGITPKKMPDEVLLELSKVAENYYSELSKKDKTFSDIFTDYRSFQRRTGEWMRISEQAVFEYREMIKNHHSDNK